MFRATSARIAASVLMLAMPLPAVAQDHALVLELNNAQDIEGDICELTILTENATGTALERAAWQFAIFDADGRVRALPVIDFGALPEGKTKLVAIGMPGRSCTQVSRIVVNDVAECLIDGESRLDLCLTGLSTRSLVDIAFGL